MSLNQLLSQQGSRWSFGHPSNVLTLSQDPEPLHLELTSAQALEIRSIGAATVCLRVVAGGADPIDLILVGRKTGVDHWGGLSSRASDVDGVVAAVQRALTYSEQIVSEVNSLVVVIDRDNRITRFNRLCEESSGMREADLIGVDAHELFLPVPDQADARASVAGFFQKGESYETVRPVIFPAGQRQVHWRNKLVRGVSEEDICLVCSGTDITEDLANRQRLYEQATQDRATGLPNGRASRQQIDDAIGAGLPVTFIALVVLNYRQLRGNLGLAQCDRLMKQVADAIVASVPGVWMVSRPGGPEFRLHAEGARSDDELMALTDAILRALAKSFEVAGVQVRPHVAMGVARLPDNASNADDLERAADAAMHAAMTRPGSSVELYANRMRDELADGLWLDSQLHAALEGDELELWYQPKVDLADGGVSSVEALIRWKHPEAGYIGPDRFIPRAEASGLIVRIGRWVVQTAARQARSWAAAGTPLRISVNVSAKQVAHDPTLVDLLKQAQADCGGMIDVELTESSFMEDAQAAQAFIERCHELGCGVHLDDFGTGYSSLGQLSGLNLTAVKLDRTFISDQGDSPRQRAMLEAIARLARALNLDVIAEGVETEAMALTLQSIGVKYAQGWHYSKAVSATDLLTWLGDKAQVGLGAAQA